MAILITQEMTRHDKLVQCHKELRSTSLNLIRTIDEYLKGQTTRSQLNKAVRSVRWALEDEEQPMIRNKNGKDEI